MLTLCFVVIQFVWFKGSNASLNSGKTLPETKLMKNLVVMDVQFYCSALHGFKWTASKLLFSGCFLQFGSSISFHFRLFVFPLPITLGQGHWRIRYQCLNSLLFLIKMNATDESVLERVWAVGLFRVSLLHLLLILITA